jgi:glutamate dehydrogenase
LGYPDGVDPAATGELLGGVVRSAGGHRATESDGLGPCLCVAAGMPWHRVVILRSYAKYLRQIGNTNS